MDETAANGRQNQKLNERDRVVDRGFTGAKVHQTDRPDSVGSGVQKLGVIPPLPVRTGL